jgi:hypothetical protein
MRCIASRALHKAPNRVERHRKAKADGGGAPASLLLSLDWKGQNRAERTTAGAWRGWASHRLTTPHACEERLTAGDRSALLLAHSGALLGTVVVFAQRDWVAIRPPRRR